MKKHHKDIDNENTTEYNTVKKSTAFSNVRRIIFLFSGLFFTGIGCAIFYHVGSEGVISGLLPLILGFFSIKEVFFPYNKKEKGGLFGKPGTFSRKANVGCLVITIICICFIIYVYYSSSKVFRDRGYISLAQQNLVQVFRACEKYWEANPSGNCSLPTSDEVLTKVGLYPAEVDVSIKNGQKDGFVAIAKHHKNDKILQIDYRGNIYIQALDCLLDINTVSVGLSNEELKEECRKHKKSEDKKLSQ
ncbi:MAG: hypothetical protein JRJ41_03465 [Deltaproteobacteria bacterium]|nr:hypothetical protein [Deltaproteobacteria bacterium]